MLNQGVSCRGARTRFPDGWTYYFAIKAMKSNLYCLHGTGTIDASTFIVTLVLVIVVIIVIAVVITYLRREAM